jgi:hypothetical protein
MVLRIGDQVRFDGLVQTVVGLSGTLVRLADEQGRGSVVHLPYLLGADGFSGWVSGSPDRCCRRGRCTGRRRR